MRAEVEHRFGDRASIIYLDASQPEVIAAHQATVSRIEEQGLIYPVTFVDGEPLYDGAVSYPAIMRAIQSKLPDSAGGVSAVG